MPVVDAEPTDEEKDKHCLMSKEETADKCAGQPMHDAAAIGGEHRPPQQPFGVVQNDVESC